MIKQNDDRCMPIIRRIGCFVRSCGAIAELKTGKELSAYQINILWVWAKKHGYVNDHDDVVQSAPIATEALRMLGDTGRFVEIATKYPEKAPQYYGWVDTEMKNGEKYFIQKIRTHGKLKTHFRVVNEKGKLVFDPFEPAVHVVGEFHTVVYLYLGG